MRQGDVSDAQDRVIGRVFERETGAGVAGVVVAVRGRKGAAPVGGTTTGSGGRFSLAVDADPQDAATRLGVWTASDLRPVEVVSRCVERGRGGVVAELGVAREDLADTSPTADRDDGRRGRLRVRVVGGDGSPVTAARRLLVAEHRRSGKRQVRAAMEGDGDFEVDVRAGTCSVQVAARDHAVARRAVTVEPGRTEEVEIALAKGKPPRRTPEERLRRFHLDPDKVELRDLVLEDGQRMVCDRRQGPKQPGFVELRPRSIRDLKQFIGTPDAMFGHEEPRFGALPAVRGELAEIPKTKEHYARFPASAKATLEHLAQEYIHGNSASVSSYEGLLDAYLEHATLDISIFGWFFDVVTINAGSVLELGTTQTVLAASKLRIHTTGRLNILGPSTVDIGEYEEFN